MFKRVYTSAWMRAFLSEERNVLRIRAAKSFGECGGPGRGEGGGGYFDAITVDIVHRKSLN